MTSPAPVSARSDRADARRATSLRDALVVVLAVT